VTILKGETFAITIGNKGSGSILCKAIRDFGQEDIAGCPTGSQVKALNFLSSRGIAACRSVAILEVGGKEATVYDS